MTDQIAQLGIEVESTGVDKAKVSLDSLAQSGERAEQAAKGVGESWSSVSQKAGAAAGSLNNAGNAFKAGNDAIRQQQQELSKLLGQIDPVIGALDRLDQQEQKLRSFRAAGALDEETFQQFNQRIQQSRSALGTFDESLAKTGVSANQTKAALRQLPAQFSDIFISLQAGQSPLSVFLQQGAQIKDSFGGVGAALRETAKYAAGLVNPFTLAAAAATALGVAFVQGADEATEYNKALILTGNAAGTTADQLAATAQAIDGVVGTQAKAAEVLAQLAASGKLSADQFELLGTAAISFERATGQAIEKSIDQYVKLGQAPVETLLKLNEGTNFLTESVLEQVIALQRQGKELEAARVAQEAWANSQIERSGQVTNNLGYLETAWNGVGDAAREAWDFMLGIGRDDGTTKLDRLRSSLEEIQNSRTLLGALTNPAAFGASFGSAAEDIQAEIKLIEDRQKAAQDAARDEGITVAERNKRLAAIADQEKKRVEAQKEFGRIVESNLTKEQKLQSEIASIRKTGAAAGVDAAEIERQVQAAERAFEESNKRRASRPKAAAAIRDDAATTLLLNLREQESALQLQLNTTDKLTAAERERAKFIQQIADLQSKDVLTAEQKSLLANQEAIKAQLDKNVAIEREIQLRNDALKLQDRAAQVQSSIDAARRSEAEQRELELQSFGLGSRAREQLQEERKIRQEFQRFQEELARDVPADLLGSEQYKKAVAEIEVSLNQALEANRQYYRDLEEAQGDWVNGANQAFDDYIDNANDIASQTNDLFSSALGGIEDSFVELATTGKTSFKDLADSIIADIVRIGTRLLISETVGMLGGGSGNSSNTAGLLSGIASLFGGAGGASAGYTGAFGFEGGGFTGTGERAGGLDGRGGFMAMLHPNETVIDHTRNAAGGSTNTNAVNIGNIVLPGVTDRREAREAGAVVARQINGLVMNSARYS